MILPFSTQMNGKPNYFIERIWEGLLRNVFESDTEYQYFLRIYKKQFGKYWDWFPDGHPRLENPKIHTIREDTKDRWKAGNKIDFFINCRQKDMFRFAPALPVVSVQKITVLWYRQDCNAFLEHMYAYKNRNVRVYIDGDAIKKEVIKQLAINDGFDTPEDFFAYFNEDFKGKIIHWTDLRY